MTFPNPFSRPKGFQPLPQNPAPARPKSGSGPQMIGSVPGGEFVAWHPLPEYAATEKHGNVDWKGGKLEPITFNDPLPHITLRQIFEDLFDRLWVKGQTPTTPQQRSFLANTRQANPAKPTAGPYVPEVNPTTMPKGMINHFAAHQTKHLAGIASDWEFHKTLERVSAYTFRGDGRDPKELQAYGGFRPSNTRTDDAFIRDSVYPQFCDYFSRRFGRDLKATVKPDEFLAMVRSATPAPHQREAFVFYNRWRALAKTEEYHLGRMLVDETLKAYLSTSKSTAVAKGFACKRASDHGWVYCARARGGFMVPEKGASQWTQAFGEQEIAVATDIPWTDVVAAREVDKRKFVGPVLVRPNFDKREPKAFEKVFRLLSGENQA